MIMSTEISNVLAQQNAIAAQNANYAAYLSSLYGGNPYATVGGAPIPVVEDPRADGLRNLLGINQIGAGGFQYGETTAPGLGGYTAHTTGLGLELMEGLAGGAGIMLGAMQLGAAFGKLPRILDPFSFTLRASSQAMQASLAGAGFRAPAGAFGTGWFKGLTAAGHALRAGRVGAAISGVAAGVGAGAIAAGPFIGLYLAARAAHGIGMDAVRHQAEVQEMLGALGTRQNLPMMGRHVWSIDEAASIAATIRNLGYADWRSNPQEITGLVAQGLQNGLFRNVRSPIELQGAIRELISALRDTARTFNTTMSGAVQYITQFRQMGFTNPSQAAAAAQLARAYGAPAGLSPEFMIQVGQAGYQQAGMFGLGLDEARLSAVRAMQFAGRVGYSVLNNLGGLSQDTLFRLTGQTGAAGVQAYMQQMTQMAMRFAQSRIGRLGIMAAMDPTTGELDSSDLWRVGDLGAMISGARGTVRTRAGRVRWMLQGPEVMQQAISEMGADVFLGMNLRGIIDRAGIRDPMEQLLFIQRRFNIPWRHAQQALLAAATSGQTQRRLLHESEEERWFQEERIRMQESTLGAIIGRGWSAFVEAPKQVIGGAYTSAYTAISRATDALGRSITGTPLMYSPTTYASDLFAKAMRGDASDLRHLAYMSGMQNTQFVSFLSRGSLRDIIRSGRPLSETAGYAMLAMGYRNAEKAEEAVKAEAGLVRPRVQDVLEADERIRRHRLFHIEGAIGAAPEDVRRMMRQAINEGLREMANRRQKGESAEDVAKETRKRIVDIARTTGAIDVEKFERELPQELLPEQLVSLAGATDKQKYEATAEERFERRRGSIEESVDRRAALHGLYLGGFLFHTDLSEYLEDAIRPGTTLAKILYEQSKPNPDEKLLGELADEAVKEAESAGLGEKEVRQLRMLATTGMISKGDQMARRGERVTLVRLFDKDFLKDLAAAELAPQRRKLEQRHEEYTRAFGAARSKLENLDAAFSKKIEDYVESYGEYARSFEPSAVLKTSAELAREFLNMSPALRGEVLRATENVGDVQHLLKAVGDVSGAFFEYEGSRRRLRRGAEMTPHQLASLFGPLALEKYKDLYAEATTQYGEDRAKIMTHIEKGLIEFARSKGMTEEQQADIRKILALGRGDTTITEKEITDIIARQAVRGELYSAQESPKDATAASAKLDAALASVTEKLKEFGNAIEAAGKKALEFTRTN